MQNYFKSRQGIGFLSDPLNYTSPLKDITNNTLDNKIWQAYKPLSLISPSKEALFEKEVDKIVLENFKNEGIKLQKDLVERDKELELLKREYEGLKEKTMPIRNELQGYLRKYDYEKRINVELNLKIDELNCQFQKQKDENNTMRDRIKEASENDENRHLTKEQYDGIINELKKQIDDTHQRKFKTQTQIDHLWGDTGARQELKNKNISNSTEKSEPTKNIASVEDKIDLIELMLPKMQNDLSSKQGQIKELETKITQAEQDYETVKSDSLIIESKLNTCKGKESRLVNTIRIRWEEHTKIASECDNLKSNFQKLK